MRRLALSAFALVALALPAPARAVKVCAYAIPAEMLDKVASANARVGDPFRFRTTEELTLDDGMVIPAGTLGYGIIRAASAAGRHDKNGVVALEPRYLIVEKPDGAGATRLDVAMNPTLPLAYSPDQSLIEKGLARVPLPVPGLVMSGVNAVRWGKNITIGPGFTFSVLPVGNLARSPVC
ncbi:MAG TPA: hypothetical protein VMD91_19010 [Candidatus Sulfotelmatobacter sp.]|nr:hypothetical protein [Candidatus Sulfotelmatobacter sp.]